MIDIYVMGCSGYLFVWMSFHALQVLIFCMIYQNEQFRLIAIVLLATQNYILEGMFNDLAYSAINLCKNLLDRP